jgi:hypothetical protein
MLTPVILLAHLYRFMTATEAGAIAACSADYRAGVLPLAGWSGM